MDRDRSSRIGNQLNLKLKRQHPVSHDRSDPTMWKSSSFPPPTKGILSLSGRQVAAAFSLQLCRRFKGQQEMGGHETWQRNAPLLSLCPGTFCLIGSHWQKSQVRQFFGCSTADSQADEDQNQLNNNLKINELQTFASDCSMGCAGETKKRKGLPLSKPV